MASLSTYLANKLIDLGNGVAAYSLPTVWVGLVTTASSPAGPGSEANYTGYARVPLSGAIGSASSGSATNSVAAVTFPTCLGGANVIVGFFTSDSAAGGNMLRFGTCSLSVASGVVPTFDVGNLTTTLT